MTSHVPAGESRTSSRVGTYLVALFADTAGDAAFILALTWFAGRVGGGTVAALVLIAGLIPRIVAMLVGGALGDRWGLAKTASITLAARTALMLAFAAVMWQEARPGAWVLASLSFSAGLIDALHLPSMTGLAGLIAAPGEQAVVQGRVSAVSRTAGVLATVAAGALLAWSPLMLGLLGALLHVLAWVGVLTLRRSSTDAVDEVSEPEDVRGLLVAGLRFVAGQSDIRSALLAFSLANLAATAPVTLGLSLRGEANGWGSIIFGILYASFALGAVIGGAVITGVIKPTWRTIHGATIPLAIGAIALLVLALSSTPWLLAIALLLAGSSFSLTAAFLMGTVREVTPPELMGRVSSVTQLSIFALIPVSHLLYGAIGDRWGYRTAGLFMVALLAGVAAFTWSRTRPGGLSPLRRQSESLPGQGLG